MTQNGDARFDYRLQVWVSADNIVLGCGHPQSMGAECCNARRFAGMTLSAAYAQHLRSLRGGEGGAK